MAVRQQDNVQKMQKYAIKFLLHCFDQKFNGNFSNVVRYIPGIITLSFKHVVCTNHGITYM